MTIRIDCGESWRVSSWDGPVAGQAGASAPPEVEIFIGTNIRDAARNFPEGTADRPGLRSMHDLAIFSVDTPAVRGHRILRGLCYRGFDVANNWTGCHGNLHWIAMRAL
ncbi:hypothetical protein GPA27_25205 [Aromatoleum toluolicum]|uniref:Uncharacterized protein n=1 Tax=Aromatoleum toluolicum TaxID=90060 RepID=A0ABX1NMU1_9RHOO|nr:hypothetical protein [Aromatoleum toluolicum]NMG00684.1 hypothetical protein [Aromatoleum toluolicum]